MEPSKKLDAAGTLPANPPLKLHPDRGAGPAVLVPEQGGYKERFVKAVEDKYKCEKCRLVLCNPKQTECGHRFCETCMGTLLRWVPQRRGPGPGPQTQGAPPQLLQRGLGSGARVSICVAKFCWRRPRYREETSRLQMTVGPFGASAWGLGLGDRARGGMGQAEAEWNPVSVREPAAALTGLSAGH